MGGCCCAGVLLGRQAYELPKTAVQLGDLFRAMAAVSASTGTGCGTSLSMAGQAQPGTPAMVKGLSITSSTGSTSPDHLALPVEGNGAPHAPEITGSDPRVRPPQPPPGQGAPAPHAPPAVAVRVRDWGVCSASLRQCSLP